MNRIVIVLVVFLSMLCVSNETSAQTLKEYVHQRQKELAERQRVEKQKYENACQKGTLEAFQEYLKFYPEGRYVEDVKNRISDFDLWSKAASLNTLEGYNDYIQNSKFNSFRTQANDAITELKSIEEWKALKTSTSISAIETFIEKYPKSSQIVSADKRIHELKGVNYYEANNLSSAYHEFKAAGGKYALDYANQSKFDECEEYLAYNKLSPFSPEDELLAFLQKYPSSKYAHDVSNKIAHIKAKALTMFSSDSSFGEALAYAKDDDTRNLVMKYILNSKKAYSQNRKERQRQRIKANGGYMMIGLEPMDLGWNGISPNRYLNVAYYNVGASIKFGNYKSPIQFEVGIKPGVIFYNFADEDDNSYDSDYDMQTKFHLPVYAKLKINICNAGVKSKVYIAGLGFYNSVREESIENQFSVGGGAGIAWKHWDWLILYYKQDINNKLYLDDKYLGSSFVYYF